MNCRDAEAKLSWYLDGEAPEVAEHLEGCADCRAKLEKLRDASLLISKAAQTFLPKKTSARRPFAPPPGMLRRHARSLRLAAAVLLAGFFGCWGWMNVRVADPQQVLVVGSQSWVAGAHGVLRVIVEDGRSRTPQPGAKVTARLEGGGTFEAVSGADGSAEVRVPVPDAERATMTLTVVSPLGRDEIVRTFAIERPVRIMLSTDKPVYQPEQTIHVRALALSALTMKPFQGDVTLELEDANGNRIARRTAPASAFGIASADFDLADELVAGAWRVRASAGGVSSERTVDVKRYVLPKMRVEVKPARSMYAPGETLVADVHASYFFGKPVAGAAVVLEISAWVADRFETVGSGTGRTDQGGRTSFEIELPDRFFGMDLLQGDAMLRVEAAVTDAAGHTERKAEAVTVTATPLRIHVIPEGGEYVPGVPQDMFVVTSYADGRPARTSGAALGVAFATDDAGVVRLPIPAASFRVEAADAGGSSAHLAVDFTREAALQDFILRTDRVSYRAGDTLRLTVLSARDGLVYVDFVKAGQTLLTKSVDVRAGAGTLDVDLPPELQGTLRIGAYRVQDRNGRSSITRDTRVVVVDLPEDLQIRPLPRKAVFEPGEDIEVNFEVVDGQGRPVPAALGLAVVDEAVFALHASRPGLEKTYFQIEEDLLKSRWQIKDAFALSAPVLTPERVSVAVKADVPLVSSIEYRDKANRLRRSVREFNQAATGILMLLGVLTGLIALFMVLHYTSGCSLPFFLVAIVGGGVLAALLLPALASARKSSVATDLRNKAKQAEIERLLAEGRTPPAGADGGLPAPRVREWFPETLYWNPQIVTDDQGRASVRFPGADSITTWRLAASAVTRDGRLGAAESGVRVFQPFFVDLDLPVALTQGDEVWLPVAVYNYLKEGQSVKLTFAAESGFDLLDGAERTVEVAPGEVTSVRFHVRARDFGRHRLLVTAVGSTFSDAVRRPLDVVPDGKPMPVNVSDALNRRAVARVTIPADAVEGATRLWVRLYPSRFSEIVSGLENLVRLPYG
ncbi:MAG: hypothetical protein HYY18_01465 [Planctomycetes bacterium]|nr:hypothetical protein [Planctomycetota bacterium]